ncbi:DNA repair protein RAD5 [Coccidioides immitis RMSCC 3703]|uniref:DNA repair protein RAD5 n=1 Tax=Coccidioides immitis RMSCC 3703 TaxID=454286 RepID=A0A0J8QVU1_COCIT|nr:DNA repair protein RAD5 [Coccidioides immitis RMSCC 3703]
MARKQSIQTVAPLVTRRRNCKPFSWLDLRLSIQYVSRRSTAHRCSVLSLGLNEVSLSSNATPKNFKNPDIRATGGSSSGASRGGKRKAPALIDLTADDDDEVALSSQARSAPRQYVPSQTLSQPALPPENFLSLSQRLPDTQAELEEEANAAAVVESSQEYKATKGEYVNIRREPGNPYDSNAIRIDNVMGDQIGHLPRQLASKLAPYIDSADLLVEGVLAGNKGVYECPISLRLYGTSEPRQQLELVARMKRQGLPVAELLMKNSDRKKRQLQELKAAAANSSRARKNIGRGEEWNKSDNAFGVNMAPPGGHSDEKNKNQESIDDIIGQSVVFNPREMSQVVEKFGADEKELAAMPMAECPASLSTELLPYQRQGLAWMLDKESPQLPGIGREDVVQLWKRQAQAYKNIATGYVTNQAPPLASGGILADDMGLGKTIQTISLILADLKVASAQSSRTTLIISPLGVMSNWRDRLLPMSSRRMILKFSYTMGQCTNPTAQRRRPQRQSRSPGSNGDNLSTPEEGNGIHQPSPSAHAISFMSSFPSMRKRNTICFKNVKALQALLQLNIESQETCPICLDSLDQPVITACAHTFDYSCIEQVIERQHKCPLCRAELADTSNLVHPAVALGEDDSKVDVDPEESSSKIQALIKILTAHGQAPGSKTVVFSQWTSFLDLIEPQLVKHNITFTRIDGKMSSTKRDVAMATLTNDPNCTVMLASLNVCSVGLNLVAANQVILTDSWWAPAIEDQAVDRVYRLGQKRPTTVWRLVMEGSIEDRVLDIQKRKRDLMTTAFREKNSKTGEQQRARLADLEKLLQ